MKFTHGMWLSKDGYKIDRATQLREAVIRGDELWLYCSCVNVRHSGDTLQGGLLTIRLSSPAPQVIAVKVVNFAGSRAKTPAFELRAGSGSAEIRETDDRWLFSSGGTRAEIGKGAAFGFRFYQGERLLTEMTAASLAHITGPDGSCYMRAQTELAVGENIYGLGERFTPYVKNGQAVDIWNEDGGTASEQAYKNIPLYLSSRDYGIFVNHTGRVSFEVGSELVSAVQFSVPGESLEFMVFGGDCLKSVLTAYTGLTGRPPEMPLWSFGLWLSTSFITRYDEATVLSFIDGMIERGIPLSVFHFDCLWMKVYEWCNFEWDPAIFPDPAGLIRKIHERGIKVCVWINSYVGQKSKLFQEGYDYNYFINTGDGDVWQWDLWQPGLAVIDFTNPAACEWYKNYLRGLLDMGVDAFKTDFGERIPVRDTFYGKQAAEQGISYADGSDAEGMHNYYAYLYNKLVFEVLEERRGKGEACLFARSATVGCQQFPVHWGGDNRASYASMAESLRGGLSFGLSGFAYWSHDIGGFESGCNPDIYKRWTQFGLLSSHSRYHGSMEYKVPWLYGEEAVDVTRFFTRLKLRLMPYLYSLSVQAARDGLPMLRPMLLEFEDDPACRTLDRQYMLGDSLLVAPVFSPDGVVEYYLPAGRWTRLLTGEVIEGPGWRREQHDYMSLPLLVRPGSVIPMGDSESAPSYAFDQKITFAVYGLEEGMDLAYMLHNRPGQTAGLKISLADGILSLELDGLPAGARAALAGLEAVRIPDGMPVQNTENTLLIDLAAGCRMKLQEIRPCSMSIQKP